MNDDGKQTITDSQAMDQIFELFNVGSPVWGPTLVEDLVHLIEATGREIPVMKNENRQMNERGQVVYPSPWQAQEPPPPPKFEHQKKFIDSLPGAIMSLTDKQGTLRAELDDKSRDPTETGLERKSRREAVKADLARVEEELAYMGLAFTRLEGLQNKLPDINHFRLVYIEDRVAHLINEGVQTWVALRDIVSMCTGCSVSLNIDPQATSHILNTRNHGPVLIADYTDFMRIQSEWLRTQHWDGE